MPAYLLRSDGQLQLAQEPTLEAARNCTLEPYESITVKPVTVDAEIIAYTSPDSTYAVTKRFMDDAKRSIMIGIYDFTAGYMKDILLNAVARGVEVTLMLDVETTSGEAEMFEDMIRLGVNGVPAPACTSTRSRYFASCHEKFVVVDGEWVLVQSGNYSKNSIPLNEIDGGDPEHFVTGNRDTGLAVRSKKLAAFFTRILQSDISLEQNGPENALDAFDESIIDAMWLEAAPRAKPNRYFPSKTFNLSKPLEILPVLSPDNYMSVIPDMLRKAKRSILIEQQYIRSTQPDISLLLDAIGEALENNEELDVRIVLGKIFSSKDVAKEDANLKNIKRKYKLSLGKNIRYVDTTRYVHCHNKMIIVDGVSVLVSSQNWSDSAVSKNREAGLLLDHKGIAKYFTEIFENDWSTAIRKLPAGQPTKAKPETVKASGRFIEVVPADYRDV
jgi:phosphatidylserine/phosphatidylglycerophosphate/cardiolipin synthase-like enzyme